VRRGTRLRATARWNLATRPVSTGCCSRPERCCGAPWSSIFVSRNTALPERVSNTSSLLLTLVMVARSDAIAAVSVEVARFINRELAGGIEVLPLDVDIEVQPYSLITARGRILSPASQLLYARIPGPRTPVLRHFRRGPVLLGQKTFQDIEPTLPEFFVMPDPFHAGMHGPRVEVADMLPSLNAAADKAGALQHLDVL
jgi:hypothetical protein